MNKTVTWPLFLVVAMTLLAGMWLFRASAGGGTQIHLDDAALA